MIQNTSDIVSRLAQSPLAQTLSQWKGRTIELIKLLVERVRHRPLIAFAIAVIAFIATVFLFSLLFKKKANSNSSQATLLSSSFENNRSISLDVNSLSSKPLSPSSIKSSLPLPIKPPPSSSFDALSSTDDKPLVLDTIQQPLLDFSGDPAASELKLFGFTETELSSLVYAIDVDSKVGIIALLSSFCYRCLNADHLIFSLDSDEKRNQLVHDLVDLYQKREVAPESEIIDRFNATCFQLSRDVLKDHIYLKRLDIAYNSFESEHPESRWLNQSYLKRNAFLKAAISADWTIEVSQLMSRLDRYEDALRSNRVWVEQNRSLFLEQLTSELMARAELKNGVLEELDQIFEGIQQNLELASTSNSQLDINQPVLQQLLTYGFKLDQLENICREVGGQAMDVVHALYRWMSEAPLYVRPHIAQFDIAKKMETEKTNQGAESKDGLTLLHEILNYQLDKHKFRNLKYTETDQWILVFCEGIGMPFHQGLRLLATCFESAQRQSIAVPIDPQSKLAFMRAFIRNFRGDRRVPLNLDESHIYNIFIQTLNTYSHSVT